MFGNRVRHGRGITILALTCACAFGGVIAPKTALAEEGEEVVVANLAAEDGQEATATVEDDNQSNSQEAAIGEGAAAPTVIEEVTDQTDNQTAVGQDADTQITTEEVASTDNGEEVSAEVDQSESDAAANEPVAEDASEDDALDNPTESEVAATATLETQDLTNSSDNAENQEDEKRTIADGTYMFSSALKKTSVLNVKDNSSKSGANVNIADANGNSSQRWDVVYIANGFYNIFKHGTKLALTVLSGEATNSSNVGIAKKDGSDRQLWSFKLLSSGYYYIVSRLDPNFVLNLEDGSYKSGTNVNLATLKNEKQKQFKLYEAGTAEKSTVSLSSGTYTLKTMGNKKLSVDVKAKSKKSGANMLLGKAGSAWTQRFHIDADGKGYYVVSIVGSGKVLSTKNASVIPGNNVIQTSYTGDDTQKWALHKTSNGYEFVNKATNFALAVSNSKFAAGTNVLTTTRKDTAAQRYKLDRVYLLTDGIYRIASVLTSSKVVEVKGSSTKNGAAVQLNEVTDELGQRFEIQRVSNNGQELYLIRTAASGGLLSYRNGKVTQYGNHATALNKSNTWNLIWNGTFFSMKNLASGKVLGVKGGKTANGTAIVMYEATGRAAQNFTFSKANLIPDGTYILNGAVGKVVSVKEGSKRNKANIQTGNNTYATSQRFIFKSTGKQSNTYVIKNKKSGLAMTVEGASHANKANVYQAKYKRAASQKWEARVSDGGYIMLVNKESGKALGVQGGKTTTGANIQQYRISYKDAQKWDPTPIEWKISGNKYEYYSSDGKKHTWNKSVYRSWKKIKSMKSSKPYLAAIDRGHTYTSIFTKRNGMWEPFKAFLCSVGAHQSPTPAGLHRVWNKSYHEYFEYDGVNQSIWYWTNFGPNGEAFHSILYAADNPNVPTYSALGAWNSHGCVRLPINTAKWLYEKLGRGSIVYVY